MALTTAEHDTAQKLYPLLARTAGQLAQATLEKRNGLWLYADDFTNTANLELGLRLGVRRAWSLLAPLQLACLESGLPDLAALVVQKPAKRLDVGNLIRPLAQWWELYQRDGRVGEDQPTAFWFVQYRLARDHAWPEQNPF